MVKRLLAVLTALLLVPLSGVSEAPDFFKVYARSPEYFSTYTFDLSATVHAFALEQESGAAVLTVDIGGVVGDIEIVNFSDLIWYYVANGDMFVGFSEEKDSSQARPESLYTPWPRVERLLEGDYIDLGYVGSGVTDLGAPVLIVESLIIENK